MIALFQLTAFIFSVIIHEVSHGVVALLLGDTTAKDAGRLTLNPLRHVELFGSFLLPLMLYFFSNGTVIFGWAKPVPYNPWRLRNPDRDSGFIALAGPVSNLVVAIVFGLFIRILGATLNPANFATLFVLLHLIVFINVLLAIFNLVPLPPLDGSKVLFALLPRSYDHVRIFLEKYGIVLLIGFIMVGMNFIQPVIEFIYRLII